MSDAKEKLLPGIEAYIDPDQPGFAKIAMLLDATGGLSLSQVCAVTGLEGSTIQNWVKRGWVAHPKGKRYEEVHIARILIINALKECIKLEHIAHLMTYVSGGNENTGDSIIEESELFNFLCEALGRMGQASGVEAVVEDVLEGYVGSTPDAKLRIRKALSLMMYACVCTDVKRRTESMMRGILYELDNPIPFPQEPDAQTDSEQQAPVEPEPIPEPPEEPVEPEKPKTIAQTLREWDVSSVERLVIEPDDANTKKEEQGKGLNRPWFARKNVK